MWLYMKGASEAFQTGLVESAVSPPDASIVSHPQAYSAHHAFGTVKAWHCPCFRPEPPGVTLGGSLLFAFLLCGWQLKLRSWLARDG